MTDQTPTAPASEAGKGVLKNCARCKGHGHIEVTEWGRDCRPTTFRRERCPTCDGYGCHTTNRADPGP